jgi:hypothetical protein
MFVISAINDILSILVEAAIATLPLLVRKKQKEKLWLLMSLKSTVLVVLACAFFQLKKLL